MPTRVIIMAEDTSNSPTHSPDLQELPNSAFHCEKMNFHILEYRTLKYPVSFRSVSFRCAKYSKPLFDILKENICKHGKKLGHLFLIFFVRLMHFIDTRCIHQCIWIQWSILQNFNQDTTYYIPTDGTDIILTLRFLCLNERNISLVAICAVI